MKISRSKSITIKTSYLIHVIDMGRSGIKSIPASLRPLAKPASTAMHTRIELIIKDDVCKILRAYTKGTDFLSVMQSMLSIYNTIRRRHLPNTSNTESFITNLKEHISIQVFTGKKIRARKLIRDTNIEMADIIRYIADRPEIKNLGNSVSADKTWGKV
jgi:hypothetical protein